MPDFPTKIETAAIHAGELPDGLKAHVPPIYQTSTYTFDNMEAVDRYANGEDNSYIYGRGHNPSRAALAAKLAALEGYGLDQPVAAEIFGSGMAAISAALLGNTRAGDHIIAASIIYGSSDHFIGEMLPQYGITTSRVQGLAPDELARELAAHLNTRLIFLETPANPTVTLVDIAAVAEVAHAHGVKLVVDNTFATPVVQRPLTLGADFVVHSTTKYINGHGTVLGGAVVGRDVALMEEKIGPMMRYFGAVPSPFDCWLTTLGLKTLPLRMRQHCVNALEVAQFLSDQAKVTAVTYPGLEDNPQHALAKRQMDGFGAMLSFEVADEAAARRLLDQVQVCTLAVSLGNVDTLIEHPATMTHRGITPEERARIGIADGLIRLSVGLEAAEDIITDLGRALDGV
jgi:methionine-gamma-lyase